MTTRLLRWMVAWALVVASLPVVAASPHCAERRHECCRPKVERTCCAAQAVLGPGCRCEVKDAVPTPVTESAKIAPAHPAVLPAAAVVTEFAVARPFTERIRVSPASGSGGDRAPPRPRGPPVLSVR